MGLGVDVAEDADGNPGGVEFVEAIEEGGFVIVPGGGAGDQGNVQGDGLSEDDVASEAMGAGAGA